MNSDEVRLQMVENNNSIVWRLDIGGTKSALISGDESGKILWQKQIATIEYPHWEELLEALLTDTPEMNQIAIGVSCGGPLNSRRGLIVSPPNLP